MRLSPDPLPSFVPPANWWQVLFERRELGPNDLEPPMMLPKAAPPRAAPAPAPPQPDSGRTGALPDGLATNGPISRVATDALSSLMANY